MKNIEDLMNVAFSYDAPSMPNFAKVGEISESEKDSIVELLDEELNSVVAAGCKEYAARFCRNYGTMNKK